MQHRQTDLWTWKSTIVTSLQAVFQLLRIYRALPQDRLRVFSSPCKEDLTQTRLNGEENTLTACSVTATEFLQARKVHISDGAHHEFDQRTAQTSVQCSTPVPLASSLPVNSVATSSLATSGMHDLEKRRLKQEMGSGGDHDLPYTFLLPPALAEVRVWVRLLAQVHRGEFQP
jgi:hypothetical protein